MALGTPAVVSDRGASPEVAGMAGAIVSPLNVEEFSQVICRMLTDGRAYRQATAQGREGVPRTTWADYAREMGRIYAELV
jgi:glycosyltransferase involved in cell wall biosynthesis